MPQPLEPPSPDQTPSECQLTLTKQGQRYVLRYQLGQEVEMLRNLARMADDPQSDIDWYDAALLSHQVGQRLMARVRQQA